MGHKIHPTAFRLAVNQTWLSLTHPNGAGSAAHNDSSRVYSFIYPLIHNSFLALNILTSFPVIKITPKSLHITVKIHPGPSQGLKVGFGGDRGPDSQRAAYISVFLKSMLQKKLNTRVQLTLIYTDNLNSDAKIMGDWLAMTIGNRPLRLKGIVKGVLGGPSHRDRQSDK